MATIDRARGWKEEVHQGREGAHAHEQPTQVEQGQSRQVPGTPPDHAGGEAGPAPEPPPAVSDGGAAAGGRRGARGAAAVAEDAAAVLALHGLCTRLPNGHASKQQHIQREIQREKVKSLRSEIVPVPNYFSLFLSSLLGSVLRV